MMKLLCTLKTLLSRLRSKGTLALVKNDVRKCIVRKERVGIERKGTFKAESCRV